MKKNMLKIAIGISFLLLALLLSFYFIFINSSILILYSFLAFIILGVAISHRPVYIEYALSVSMGLIVASSLVYFGIPTYALYVGSIVMLGGMLILGIRSKYNAVLVAVLIVIAFFTASATAKYNTFTINMAIIGYYLLISVVIAEFASMITENSRFKWWHKIARVYLAKEKYYNATFLAIALLLLFLPIWPMGEAVNVSLLPYANMTITGINSSANLNNSSNYLLQLNLSMYNQFISDGGSNIRFAYGNSTHISAIVDNLSSASAPLTHRYVLLDAHIRNGSIIRVYFFAINTSFGNHLKPETNPEFNTSALNSSVLTVSMGAVNNARYKTVNITATYYSNVKANTTQNYTVTLYPYYNLQSICSEGNDSTAIISMQSISPVSVFIFNNLSDYSAATVSVQPSYMNYLREFSSHSFAKDLNFTNASIRFSLQGCRYYSFIINSSKAVIHVVYTQDYTYKKPYQGTKEQKLPTISDVEYDVSGFFWNSVGYVYMRAVTNKSINGS